MSGRIFLDSNVLIYAATGRDEFADQIPARPTRNHRTATTSAFQLK